MQADGEFLGDVNEHPIWTLIDHPLGGACIGGLATFLPPFSGVTLIHGVVCGVLHCAAANLSKKAGIQGAENSWQLCQTIGMIAACAFQYLIGGATVGLSITFAASMIGVSIGLDGLIEVLKKIAEKAASRFISSSRAPENSDVELASSDDL
ncbi:MAG: hypothetical protein WB791_02315 [Waddliaceae bacterium]